MYITGNIGNYAGRIHKLPTGISDITSFASEANTNYLSSIPKYTYNRWEKELRKKSYNLTKTPSYLSTQILNTFGGDPYNGKLVYVQVGGAITTETNPVGARDLSAITPKVTEIHCHNCPSITSVTCSSNASLTVLDLQNLPAVTSLTFDNCTSLTSVNLDTFTSVTGNITFHTCSSLASFSAANLTTVGGNLYLILTALTTAYLPALTSVGEFGASGNSLLSVSLPVLVTCTGTFYTANSALLTSISCPLLQTIGSSGLVSNNCAALISALFPSLISITAIVLNDCPNLSSVNFSHVQTVTSSISIYNDTSLVNFNLTSYLGALPSSIAATGCTLLDAFYINSALASDGSNFDLTFCSLDQTSVNGFIQALTDGSNTTTVLYMNGGTNSAPDLTHANQVTVLINAPNSNDITTN